MNAAAEHHSLVASGLPFCAARFKTVPMTSSTANPKSSGSSIKTADYLKGFLVTSLLGWGNALYTLWHRQSLMYGTPSGKSFCNISATVNCDAVAMAPESAIFFGYPTSALGLMFYCFGFFLALALYFEKNRQTSKTLAKALLLVTLVGLVPTVLLAGLSMFRLKMLCLMCLASYFLNTIMVVLSVLILRRFKNESAGSPLDAFPKKLFLAAAIAVAIQAPLPWVFKSVAAGQMSESEIGLLLYQHSNAPKFRFRTEGAALKGKPDAKVQIVEFADFQCPTCAKASEALPNVLASYKEDVSLIFKNFPLDSSCNSNLDRPMHPVSCTAALGGLCVLKKAGSEAFYKYEMKTFENYQSLSINMVENLVKEFSGINPQELKTCIESSEINEELQRQISEARAAGVQGTPSIFVNGKMLEAGFHPMVLRRVIQEYLKQ